MEKRELEIDDIFTIVSQYFKIDKTLIKSTSHVKEIVKARQVVMYFICFYFDKMFYREIGNLFNGKDHSTVIYSMKKVASFIEIYPDYKHDIQQMEKKINLIKLNYQLSERIINSEIWGENDYYPVEQPVQSFKGMGQEVSYNGYSGYREHSR